MRNQHSTMQEYEANLQARAHDYQAAQADSKLIRIWFGTALHWLGSQLMAWGQALQPERGHIQWQTPPQA